MLLFKLKKLLSNILNQEYRSANKLLVFAATEHEKPLKSLSCHTVVDVGANRGQFALVARYVYPKAKIIAFEPLPEPSGKLINIFKKDKNFTLMQCALGEQQERTEFHISKRDDSSSLLKISKKQSEYFPGTEECESIPVEVNTLDMLMPQFELSGSVLLKLDVQGGELAVLKGGVSFLQQVTYVYVEASFVELYEKQALAYEVMDFLQKAGFALQGVYNVSYDKLGLAIQADFLFRKRQ